MSNIRRFLGQLDGLNGGLLYGWLLDCENPADPCEIKIWVDHREFATISADQHREDVLAAGYGTGKHGFNIDLTDILADGNIHEIKVLGGAGYMVGSLTYSPYFGRIDSVDGNLVRGCVGNLYDPYKLVAVDLLYEGGVVCSAEAQEGLAFGLKSELSVSGAGFRLVVPDEFLADERRKFNVVFSGTSIDLENSPIELRRGETRNPDLVVRRNQDHGSGASPVPREEESQVEDELKALVNSDVAKLISETDFLITQFTTSGEECEIRAEDQGDELCANDLPVEHDPEVADRPEEVDLTQEPLEEARLERARNAAIRIRRALERNGLWYSGPLDESKIAEDEVEQICFDATYYALISSESPSAGTREELLAQFHEKAFESVVKPNVIFDEFWYVRRYGDVLQTIVQGKYRSGLEHFLYEGLAENKSPTVWFDPPHYAAQLPDAVPLDEFVGSTFLHFLEGHGPNEISPSRYFNTAWYLATYPNVAGRVQEGEFGSALAHYLKEGAGDGCKAARDVDNDEFTDADGDEHSAYRWSKFFTTVTNCINAADTDSIYHRGKTLIILNTNVQTRNHHITRAIVVAARSLLGAENVHYVNYGNVVDVCASVEQPILLCIDGQRINVDIVYQARLWSARAVLWTFDDPYNLKSHQEIAHLFDVVFTNDASSVQAYDGKGFFLPLAAPTDLEPKLKRRFDFDLFFCGTAWPNRVALINKLMRDRPNLRMKLVLSYNQHLPPMPTHLPLSAYVGTLAFADYVRFAQRSKITLALHRNFSGTDTIDASSSPGPRIFEIGAAGAFQLCENGGSDFERMFSHEVLTYFSSYADLLEKLDRLLEDDEERERRAAHLQRIVLRRHTYKHRLSIILTECQRRKGGDTWIATKRSRKKILYVVHNTIESKNYGGLEIHQDILMQNLKNDYDIFFFYTIATGDSERSAILADNQYRTLASQKIKAGVIHGYLESPQFERFFGECISRHQFDLIHFFHFLNNVPSLAHIARAYGAPYVISIHDFYIACRSFNLLDHRGNYCRNDMGKIDDCDICLSSQYKFPTGSQIIRRDYYGEILKRASALIFMSESTRDIMEGIYPEIQESPLRRIHGAPIPNPVWPVQRRALSRKDSIDGRSVRFVILGNFHANKGAAYLCDALIPCESLQAEFHFHGPIDNNYKERLSRLMKTKVFFHGSYSPGSLNLDRYDFSLHLSNWPETYCQTLSEAWAARLVPIVADIGALGERVSHGVNGFKVDPERPGTLTSLFKEIVENPISFLAVTDNISDSLFLKQTAHARMYQEAYEAVLGCRSAPPRHALSHFSSTGTSMAMLGRNRHNALWNTRRVSHPDDNSILPDKGLLTFRNTLHEFGGKLETATANLEYAGRGRNVKNLAEETIELRNGEPIFLVGWVSLEDCPVERRSEVVPVALIERLSPYGGRFIQALNREARPDVASVFDDSSANDWGIVGPIRLLTPDEIIVGPVKIRVGWLDPAADRIYTSHKAVQAIGVYGG